MPWFERARCQCVRRCVSLRLLGSMSAFIETQTGNRISRACTLCGTQNIHIHGKSTIQEGAVVRGDLANIKLAKYVSLAPGCVLRPAGKVAKGALAFFSLTIGDYVVIEDDCVIEASVIGSNVFIGKGSVIGKRCVIKDCCYIRENTVLPPDSVVAPFSVFAGCPGRFVEETVESMPAMMRSIAQERYFEAC